MNSPQTFEQHRLLLFYKGDISALMLFAQGADGSVCFPEPLPALSSALEEDEPTDQKISVHPATLLNHIKEVMNLDDDLLQIDPDFSEGIDTPNGTIIVHMARFMLLDPPHKLMQSRKCRMRTLPELRNQPPAELELLRRAYVTVMEG